MATSSSSEPAGVATHKNSALLLVFGVILAVALYSFLVTLPAIRVGDGSEYYAMQRAVATQAQPYMTEESWARYDELVQQGNVLGLVPTEQLRGAFPALRVESSADFNHFWAYPALAAAVEILTPGSVTPHNSFILLHVVMLALLVLACARWHGAVGAIAALVVVFASPALWFLTKAHTEFFTVVLTTGAAAAALSARWHWTGLLLAIASTQNISFGLPAVLACFYAAVAHSGPGQQFTKVVVLVCAGLIAALHPLYYFFRYGVITPQLLAGGASLEDGSPLVALNYLLDPDVGLLPNWPIGVVIALAAIFYVARGRGRQGWRIPVSLSFFFACYVGSCLVAQGATVNINSGATVNVARYGLWFICLFYPALLILIREASEPKRRLLAALLIVLVVPGLVYNSWMFDPRKGESYLTPSPASSLIYRHLPSLNDPPAEVFLERYGAIGEGIPPRPAIVMSEGCRKWLVLGGPGDPDRTAILGRSRCGMVPGSIVSFARNAAKDARDPLGKSHYYLSVSANELTEQLALLPRGMTLNIGGDSELGTAVLYDGWSAIESWGAWNQGKKPTIIFRTDSTDRPLRIQLSLNAYFAGDHRRLEVFPTANGARLPSFSVSEGDAMPASRTIELPTETIAESAGVVKIEFRLSNTISPSWDGGSSDTRELGLGLVAISTQ